MGAGGTRTRRNLAQIGPFAAPLPPPRARVQPDGPRHPRFRRRTPALPVDHGPTATVPRESARWTGPRREPAAASARHTAHTASPPRTPPCQDPMVQHQMGAGLGYQRRQALHQLLCRECQRSRPVRPPCLQLQQHPPVRQLRQSYGTPEPCPLPRDRREGRPSSDRSRGVPGARERRL